MKSILTIGEILVEIMATEPGDGFLEPVKLIGPFPSGAPAIFIDQAARFGQPAAMIGCVGDDDFGRVNLNRLRRDGVDVSGIRIDPEAVTGSAFVRYRADGSRAFVFNIKQSASGRIELDAAARAVLARSDHLHVMGTALFSAKIVDIVLHAVEAVKARGGTISFDPNLRPEMLNTTGPSRGLRRRCSADATCFCRAAPNSPCSRRPRTRAPRSPKSWRAASVPSSISGARRARAIATRDTRSAAGIRGRGDRSDRRRRLLRRDVRELLAARPAARRCLAYAAASGALAVTRQGPMEGAASQAELDAFLAARSWRASQ